MPLRVILDPNILISHLLPSKLVSLADRVVDAAVSGVFTPLISDELLHELITRVQQKPYLARNITSADLAALLDALSAAAERVDLAGITIPRIVRDPDDDYLIAMADTGNADILVSGDHDLLDIADLTAFRILSMRAFADLLTEEDLTVQPV